MDIITARHSVPRLHARGFTLFELLTSLSVLVVLTTLAAPPLSGMLNDNRIAARMNLLVSSLHLTRSLAIQTGGRAVMCPSPQGIQCQGTNQWSRGWIVFADSNGNNARDTNEPVARRIGPQDTLSVTSGSRSYRVRYFPNGASYFSNTTFVFCDHRGAQSARAVILSNTGRPRTSRRDPGGNALTC